MKIMDIASNFVNLILKHKSWNHAELSTNEMEIIFAVVAAAGFDPREIKEGKLTGKYLDQDGSSTGETYPINSFCPFRVVCQDGGDNYFATGWLDCAFRRVAYGSSRNNENPEELIQEIIKEVERSVPLEPIQLTREGEMLLEYPPSSHHLAGFQYFVDHTRDDYQLSSCVGVHAYCSGWLDRMQATQSHDAIVCRRCHLRVLFPKEVVSYGDLRQSLIITQTHVPV